MPAARQCPRCATPLSPFVQSSLAVDGCGCCGGIWFDAQELGALGWGSDGSLRELECRFHPDTALPHHHAPGLERFCPACAVEMRAFEYPWAKGIRLDGCSLCRGIWIDNEELERLERTLRHLRPALRPPTTDHRPRTAARRPPQRRMPPPPPPAQVTGLGRAPPTGRALLRRSLSRSCAPAAVSETRMPR